MSKDITEHRKKIILSKKGKFLQFYEVDSHFSQVCYDYTWVSDINKATLLDHKDHLLNTNWKLKSPECDFLCEINVMVERLVTLLKPVSYNKNHE